MKLDVVPETLLERLALRAGLVPRPFLQTVLAGGMARALLVAVKLGVFETLKDSAMTSEEVAGRIGTHPYPTGKLLNALTGMSYLSMEGGRYSLTTDARKWLLDGSPTSLRDWILEQEFIEWRHIDRLEDFVIEGSRGRLLRRRVPVIVVGLVLALPYIGHAFSSELPNRSRRRGSS
ncbi:MAG TPA: methyltransferase dimerization domain-containing protein [Actinomycetota bacterium]